MELASFRDQISALVERMEGQALLDTLEGQVGCSVRLRVGSGAVTGFVRQLHEGAELRVEDKPTDQSYLQQSVRDIDALLKAFPQRGNFPY
jgi:hypothetical protein